MFKALVLFLLLASCDIASAQGRLLLDEQQARRNLLVSRPPVVPSGRHQSGKVVLLVQIGPDGRVTSAKPDSGPSTLRDAAADAVKQWRFKPFRVHDEKVTASTKLTVDFGALTASAPLPQPAAHQPAAHQPVAPPPDPPKVDAALQQFQAAEEQCRTLVTAHADPAQEARACRDAADLAGALKTANRFPLQRSADVFAATALMRTDDLKLAIAYGTKAVELIAEGHDDESGSSAAYAVRGQAKAFAGDLPGADLDLAKAEAFERKAVAASAGKPDGAESHAALKNLLLFHAQLLKALNQPDKAALKAEEAGRL